VKVGRGRIPPNGWHFQISPGVRLEAINEEELTKQIFEHRLRNNIPIGDIERDIDDYYCTKWPQACHKEPKDLGDGTGPDSPPAEKQIHRVARWASSMIHGQPKGGYTLVSMEEANRRADLCVGCTRNQPWRVGCSGCNNSTTTVLAQIRKTQSSRQQGNLMSCAVAGWDNATAVFMPKEDLKVTDGQLQALPPRCWRKG